MWLVISYIYSFFGICGGGRVFHGSSINLFLCSDSYWTEILSRYWTKYMAPYKHYPRPCWWWWQADMSKYPVSREVLISQRSFGSRVRPFIFIGSPESRQYPSLYLTTSSISVPQLEATKSATRQQTTTTNPFQITDADKTPRWEYEESGWNEF